MLRASSDATGSDYRAAAITAGTDAGDGNIPHGALLVEFAEAAYSADEASIAAVRERLEAELGCEGVVDTCGVVANFQRMVRVADGTGIPLDERMFSLSSDLRADLGLNDFAGNRQQAPGTVSGQRADEPSTA